MKIEFQGYLIDSEKETDQLEVSSKLTFLLYNYYPTMDIYAAKYEYSQADDTITILIKRKAKYWVEGDWVSSGDSQLLTGLPKEYFYPAPFGGKDNGYFGLIGYHDDYYANGDRIVCHLKDYQAKGGVKDVHIAHTDEYLVVKFMGK